jgi:hypothetical protein
MCNEAMRADRRACTREDYDTLLRAKGFTQYKAGYIPYSIVDGWQKIRKDFAYWRAAVKGAETASTPRSAPDSRRTASCARS